MHLSQLPDLVLEKIINAAAENEFNSKQHKWHKNGTWMMIIQKYAQVSRRWENVIFNSKVLFEGTIEKETTSPGYTFPRFGIEKKGTLSVSLLTGHETQDDLSSEIKIRRLIKNGYLKKTKELDLYLIGTETGGETLNLIRQFNGESSIESYSLTTHSSLYRNTAELERNLSSFVELILENKRTNMVDIDLIIHTVKDAEICLQMLLTVVQIDTIKHIKFSLDLTNKIDWNLVGIGNFSDVKIDHITKIELKTNQPFPLICEYCNFDRGTLFDLVAKFKGEYKFSFKSS